MNFEKVMKKLLEFRDARDRKQFHNPKDLVEAISIEVGELMEKFLWKSQEESYLIAKDDPEVADELADIMNYILLFAQTANINLEKAIFKKIDESADKYPVEKAKGNATKYNKL